MLLYNTLNEPTRANLHTNYVPTDDEWLEINDLLAEPRERLRQLEKNIEELQAERTKLWAHISAQGLELAHGERNLISPQPSIDDDDEQNWR
uniref:Uncharacterized protein n=1 Tax=Mycena chlorophos TaxID=658473 RepID=A0ABQ0LDY5_MYCCL|nr:predicted protein [Mycena chlorophos]